MAGSPYASGSANVKETIAAPNAALRDILVRRSRQAGVGRHSVIYLTPPLPSRPKRRSRSNKLAGAGDKSSLKVTCVNPRRAWQEASSDRVRWKPPARKLASTGHCSVAVATTNPRVPLQAWIHQHAFATYVAAFMCRRSSAPAIVFAFAGAFRPASASATFRSLILHGLSTPRPSRCRCSVCARATES